MKQGSIKKKKRKKPDAATRLHAVLAAAVLILAALAVSLTVFYLHSVKTQDEAALTKEPPPAAETPAPVAIAPLPVPQETPVHVNTPPVTPPAPAPAPKTVPQPSASISAPQSVPSPAVKPPVAPPVQQPSASSSAPQSVQPSAPERLTARGALAFVIDDAGNNLRDLEPFLKFPGPLTIAVLPGLASSAEAARRIRAAGKEVFLHQPMESLGGSNPGPGAIYAGMAREEIRRIVNHNLDELWPVAGLNNHEGSRVTMDDEAMETVLAICRERGIVFLDSRTTAETAAPRAAKRLGIIIGERDVFVDNVKERESMLNYINSGLVKAEQKGSAIMIGHVSTPGLAPLLTELFPYLSGKGFPFSQASKLIRGNAP